MKKTISFGLLQTALAIFCLTMTAGFAQEPTVPAPPEAPIADMTSVSAADPACDPCANTCSECYNGIGYGYGCGYGVGYGCGAGILSAVHGAAEIALTPVHWVAGLLSCGTYGDCGCASLPCRTYRDPCDNCGNWVGGCNDCGPAGYTSYGVETTVPVESTTPVEQALPDQTKLNNTDYLDYSKIETIGQRKARQMKAAEEIPGAYIYTEEAVKGAQRPVVKAPTVASRPVARIAQRSAARPQNHPPVNVNGRAVQVNSANRQHR